MCVGECGGVTNPIIYSSMCSGGVIAGARRQHHVRLLARRRVAISAIFPDHGDVVGRYAGRVGGDESACINTLRPIEKRTSVE